MNPFSTPPRENNYHIFNGDGNQNEGNDRIFQTPNPIRFVSSPRYSFPSPSTFPMPRTPEHSNQQKYSSPLHHPHMLFVDQYPFAMNQNAAHDPSYADTYDDHGSFVSRNPFSFSRHSTDNLDISMNATSGVMNHETNSTPSSTGSSLISPAASVSLQAHQPPRKKIKLDLSSQKESRIDEYTFHSPGENEVVFPSHQQPPRSKARRKLTFPPFQQSENQSEAPTSTTDNVESKDVDQEHHQKRESSRSISITAPIFQLNPRCFAVHSPTSGALSSPTMVKTPPSQPIPFGLFGGDSNQNLRGGLRGEPSFFIPVAPIGYPGVNRGYFGGRGVPIPTMIPSAMSTSSTQASTRKSNIKATDKKRKGKTIELEDGSKKGAWTDEEHRRFLEGLKLHKRGNWKAIADHVKTRSRVQVASHAQKFFQKHPNHTV